MKKATATKGLPIMEIADGSTVGKVDKIIVQPRAKTVVYFTVRDNTVVRLSDCVGVGNDCVVIRSVDSVNKVFEEREIAETMDFGMDLFGMRAMSSAGNIIGNVVDFDYNRRSGELGTVWFDNGSQAANANILSINKGLMFVEESAVGTEESFEEALPEEPVAYAEEEYAEEEYAEEEYAEEAVEEDAYPEDDEDYEGELIEEDYDDDPYAYLLGMTVNEDVVSDDGRFIITAGTELTEDILDEAADHDALIKIALQVD